MNAEAGPSWAMKWDWAVAAVLALVLFLPGLASRDLWNPDEPRYAEVSREMMASGQYFVPHLNGQLYTQKPPLLFWSMITFAHLTGGLDEAAARLPSILAGVLAVLLVLDLGRRLFNRRAGWLAAAAFATCFKIFWQAHVGQIDMLLTFWVLAGIYCWARGWMEDRPGFYPLFFVATGFATLAKGPVGLLPPLLSIVIFLAFQKDWANLKRLRVGRGILLWAAVVLLWLIPAMIQGGEAYYREILFTQNVTRYANPWHHFRPWYYYLTVLPGDFAPWSLLLPAALVAGWRRLRPQRADSPEWRRFLFLLTWVVVTLVFFSLSPGKRTVYILTMYPALALLVGAGLDAIARDRGLLARRWLTIPLGLLTLLLTAGAVAAGWKGPTMKEAAPLGPNLPLFTAMVLAVAAAGAAAALVWAWRHRPARGTYALAAGVGLAGMLGFVLLLPAANVVKSARPLSKVLLANAAPDEPYGILPRLDPPFLFYTHRYAEVLPNTEALRAFVDQPGRSWILAERDDFAKLENLPPLVEVARDADAADGYLLLTEPPWPIESTGSAESR